MIFLTAAALLLGAGYIGGTAALVRRELGRYRRGMTGLRWERVSFTNERDGTGPQHALAVWPRGGRGLELLVLMHGLTESAGDYFSEAVHWARAGYLVLLPDLRGRSSALRYPLGVLERHRPLGLRLPGWRSMTRLFAAPLAQDSFTSAGRPDAGGAEVLDIAAAVGAARRRYGGRLSGAATILGYSGGGTGALLAAARMPGLFDRVVAFFPVVDFAAQHRELKRRKEGPHETIEAWVGGTPEAAPLRYAARDLRALLDNLRRTPTLVLGDVDDPRCPVHLLRELAQRVGGPRVLISSRGDRRRWRHQTPDEHASELHAAADLWPARRSPAASPAASERWVVAGYLLTEEIEVLAGDLQAGLLSLEIQRSAPGELRLVLAPIRAAETLPVTIRVRRGGAWEERRLTGPRGTVSFRAGPAAR